MKALVYNGARDVSIAEVPDATIEQPTDAVIKLTSTNICGSDLHMYEGRTEMEEGRVLGHENLGEVVAIGDAVQNVRVGDVVVLPFNIGCGYCRNCNAGLTGFCLTANPGTAGAAYGFAGMGPYQGGQAEYLRVPWADFNCLVLPEDAKEKEKDYVMLSDIFPTGFHATELAGLLPGESITISGGGPVGLMAALSADVKGASQVFVIEQQPDRIRLIEQLGAIPIDPSKSDPVEQILEQTAGEGTDRGAECVGYQAHDHHGDEDPTLTMNNLVAAVRPTGGIGVVGVFLPEDPGAPDELTKQGKIPFDYGLLWFKGQRIGTGQCNVKAYNRRLGNLIHHGKVTPSQIISHELPLAEAPDAYNHFDRRDDGWTKVVLKPAA
jgi:glutathione-independent formaldehyde dehydrogenase